MSGELHIMFGYAKEESKKVKGRDNFWEILLDMQLLIMKKKTEG